MKNSNLTPTQAQLISNITAQFSTLNAKQTTTQKYSIINMAHYDNINIESAEIEGDVHIHNEAIWEAEHIRVKAIVETLIQDLRKSVAFAWFSEEFNTIYLNTDEGDKVKVEIKIIPKSTSVKTPNGKTFYKVDTFYYCLKYFAYIGYGGKTNYRSIDFSSLDELFDSYDFGQAMIYLLK